jgi:hypothetical protein
MLFTFKVFGIKGSYKFRKGKKPVGISKHDQADGRKKQSRCVKSDIHKAN